MLFQTRTVDSPQKSVEVQTAGGPLSLSYEKYGQTFVCPYGSPRPKIVCPRKRILFEFRWKPLKTRRSRWNPFTHYKCEVVDTESHGTDATFIGYANNWLSLDTPPENWRRTYVGAVSGSMASYSEFESPDKLPLQGLPALYSSETVNGVQYYHPYSPSGLDDWRARALARTLPSIKNELSLINSLYELKDFSTLPRTLARLRDVPRLFTRHGKLLHKGRRLGELTQTGADGYLQAQFNIMPLLSDITGLWKALVTYRQRADKLVAESGKAVTKHFRFEMHDPSLTDVDDLLWKGASGLPFNIDYEFVDSNGADFASYMGVQRLSSTSVVKLHSQVKYVYTYSNFQREHARMLTLLDTIGVNLNPAIIWNAIPWSFVVDWVVGVSRWLNSLRRGNMDPKIDILRYCYSYQLSRVTKFSVALHNNYMYDPAGTRAGEAVWNNMTPSQEVRETVYHRGVDFPDLDLLTTSGLNLKEFSLATALGIPRVRKLGRGWRFRRTRSKAARPKKKT